MAKQRAGSVFPAPLYFMEEPMSKPRYDWWPYVKGMIRRYPELKREYEQLHCQTVTQQLSGMPSGNGNSGRAVEICAVRELPATKQREYEAVHRAVALTDSYPRSGAERIQIIDLVFWKRSHTLEGASQLVHCSYRTARRYHAEFIMTVAKFYGLLDE